MGIQLLCTDYHGTSLYLVVDENQLSEQKTFK